MRLAVVIALGSALAGCAGTPQMPMVANAARLDPSSHAAPLSEEEATKKAVDYLRGGDYGDAYFEVAGHIKQTQLMTQGANDCGPITTPVWAFHVQGRYDGWLHLDAATGRKECSSIPFIR